LQSAEVVDQLGGPGGQAREVTGSSRPAAAKTTELNRLIGGSQRPEHPDGDQQQQTESGC
jgi:hypothetical protein